eukprot:6829313-Prymnesium_polylepis.4
MDAQSSDSRGGGQYASPEARAPRTILALREADSLLLSSPAPKKWASRASGSVLTPMFISGGFSIYPPPLLKSAKCNCIARSLSLIFKATCCAPPSQPGSGLIFLPENLSPSGNGRTAQPAVRR